MPELEAESMLSPANTELMRLLELLGIASSYIDYSGDTVEITFENRLSILNLMGLRIQSSEDIRQAFADYQSHLIHAPLNKVPVITDMDKQAVDLYIRESELENPLDWFIQTESGESVSGTIVSGLLEEVDSICLDGQALSVRRWEMPRLDSGYHQLTIKWLGRCLETIIIAAPSRCYEPAWFVANEKLAGVSAQLYGLKSDRNWGIGDFSDLKDLISSTARRSIDFIVLNPLHILDTQAPEHCSPYSPLDRRFLNPLYIDIEVEPDFLACEEVSRLVASKGFQARLTELRAGEMVDYVSVSELKTDVLCKLYACFRKQQLAKKTARAKNFERWVESKGEVLQAFARFEADRLRDESESMSDPQLHCYLQWIAELQLESCQQLALTQGMAVGLVRDLAVGGDARSAEVQLNPDLFSTGASIGAPPDAFAPQGQNWGLPPINPHALQKSRFGHFIELLKDNMAHCGAIRIDHVMALLRLWWCPGSDHTGKGAYVFYPVEAMFAILRLESQRRSCVVIGEDLGVVPPEIRQHMSQSSVFSNVLFYFEKYDPVHFKQPQHFPQRALAMVSNHDVPTLSAWWNKGDLDLRREIGLFLDEQAYYDAISARESDLIQVLHLLEQQGLLPEGWRDFNIHRPFNRELCQALLRVNGRSAAQLVSLQLEDLCLVQLPVNIPGTSVEYPNWRRKMPVETRQLFTNAETAELLDAFVSARA